MRQSRQKRSDGYISTTKAWYTVGLPGKIWRLGVLRRGRHLRSDKARYMIRLFQQNQAAGGGNSFPF